ncbi:MAG: zinc ribbon-containing protein [Thiohalorhabdus sp.]
MSTSGSSPGARRYWCRKCGKEVVLTDDEEILPVCPACGHTEYLP